MPIYMKYADLLGDVDETTHANWIELHALQWGVNRVVTAPAGSAATREVMAPQVTELVIGKEQDVASIPLMQEALAGQAASVQIDFVRTGSVEIETYYSIKLTNALITGFSQASGGARPTESLTLNYTAIAVTGTQMASDGTGQTPSSYGWNVTNGAPM